MKATHLLAVSAITNRTLRNGDEAATVFMARPGRRGACCVAHSHFINDSPRSMQHVVLALKRGDFVIVRWDHSDERLPIALELAAATPMLPPHDTKTTAKTTETAEVEAWVWTTVDHTPPAFQ